MIWLWVGFCLFIFTIMAIDLGVFNRKAHEVSMKQAFINTGICVALALSFNVAVYFIYQNHWLGMGLGEGHETSGREAALKFFAGYLVEMSLSLDNVMVIAVIFSYFQIPNRFQHRTLFWGILGALVLRGVMIGVGVALIRQFDFVIYIFGLLLLYAAYKMLRESEAPELEKNYLVKLARRFYPVSPQLHDDHFFTTIAGQRAMTPLFLVLLLIESTDVLFALDSIPAIFAITRDPFIVFTSNIFAILGLRSLYFALAAVVGRLRFLKTALVILLGYIGVKMLLSHHYPVPIGISLGIIGGILGVGILASLILPEPRRTDENPVQEH